MTDKPTVLEALSSVMEEVQAIGKGDRNKQQGYDFRGIDAVVNKVGPLFRKHRIIAMPIKTESHYRDVLTSTGKPSRECTVRVTYRFFGPAGDCVDAEVPGESMDFGDKGAPKAMSVAYRILLLQALCIPTGDPDPDSQSYDRGDSSYAEEQPAPPANPLNEMRNRVQDASGERTPNEVVAHYKEWSGDRNLLAASVPELQTYLDHLLGRPA